ncbi:hypothetical protein BDV26DRAFT_275028 [Aspergillus bertholletiae]|uniref:Actin-like ATPase domain-containing protein n=1 Tax=Aspergillus bertholletiae TaxID=1226010 RepID=A0A5N7AQI0_9EURO|nr:hypothetical protein BDV26DRAFT_275028 [Aspergillus bertholletiae]
MALELIVAIDFGTTYSGVCWVVNCGERRIHLVTQWPGTSASNSNVEKVPTLISYNGREPQNWGYSVKRAEKNSFKWFKLLLESSHTLRAKAEPIVASTSLLRDLDKSVDDVATDFLHLLWEYAQDDIRKEYGPNWNTMYKVKVVLTVPAIWSPAAANKTKDVARAAGLPDNVFLVSEPEAAALAIMREKNAEGSSLKVGDSFVVCDAGGGTVDLVSYTIVSVDPLQLEECVVGNGDLSGSVFVDAAFENYVKSIVGIEKYNSLRERNKEQMMREFESTVKRNYSGDNQDCFVELVGVGDIPNQHVEDDQIILTPDVMRNLFDDIVGRIISLVKGQVDEAERKGFNVKTILLVGGFGCSNYLYKTLEDAHREDGIQVLRGPGAWSSVCRGAARWGLENAIAPTSQGSEVSKTLTVHIARYSLGICVSEPFDGNRHLEADRVFLHDRKFYATNQMEWLLKKGERVEVGTPLTAQLTKSIQLGTFDGLFDIGVRTFTAELYCCYDDHPPSRKEHSVQQLCTVEYAIKCGKLWIENSYRDPLTRDKWRDVTFTLLVMLDSAILYFMVGYQGEPVAYTVAKYQNALF